jgi:hypothetical protein
MKGAFLASVQLACSASSQRSGIFSSKNYRQAIMGLVFLVVIIPKPLLMRRQQVLPGLGFFEVPVSEPSLHIEGGLDITGPGLATGNLLFLDAKLVIDSHHVVRAVDAPGVRDEHLWHPKATDGAVKHRDVGFGILAARDGRGQDRSGKVLQNRCLAWAA